MHLFRFMLWSMLPPLALLSGSDKCASESYESPLLESLQCYNDYESYVHCEWDVHKDTMLQLWVKTDESSKQCMPYHAAGQDAKEHRTVQCRYKDNTFSIGIKHTVFFKGKKTETLCSSSPHKPLDLSLHLKALPPVNLATRDAGDGGRELTWSSPYPSSSPLNKNISYQLSYRTERQDTWTTKDVTNRSMNLEKKSLHAGHRYEARVRARVSVGQWSHWSPVVTWQTEADAGQFPSLHCVLVGEKEVMCSWEVSRELAHGITYQLACRHKQAATSERCCVNPTVAPDLSGTALKYSCSLTVADPTHLLLELQPTRNVKDFKAEKHIRPNPPQHVKVTDRDNKWIVEWTEPPRASERASKVPLYYELCYCRIQDQECHIRNISGTSTSLTIPGANLVPSQDYQVKVRSLVDPEPDFMYRGIPSEWTDPVNWTSHEATWSPATLIYFSISAFVAAVFITLYCTVPACQRRVILWVDSVPSPGKSKILAEIKSATNRTFMQNENTTMCKVQHLDSISTCSSEVWLWPTKDGEKKLLEQNEDCWKCDNEPPSPAEKVKSSDTSSMSFSGPYIFCQISESHHSSEDVKCEENEKETSSDDSAPPSPVKFTLYGDGYVCLPRANVSRSTQDLASHSDANTNTHSHDGAELDQQGLDTTPWPDKTDDQPGLDESASSHQPPAYISGPFTPWPPGGTIQASGYCHLPTDHMRV